MLNRRSQSLLEFMTTWGWVILIIAIVLGLLFSFGVFSAPSISAPVINGFTGAIVCCEHKNELYELPFKFADTLSICTGLVSLLYN